MKYNAEQATKLASDLNDVIDKYRGSMLVVTVVGILELLKSELPWCTNT